MPKRKQQEEDEENEEEEEELFDEEMPTSINPYHVLDIPVDASESDIKTAYRKAALRSHPDKVAEEHKEAAHKQFQEIAFAYAILSDERRRKRYDTTGSTEDSLDIEDDDFNWTDFFRAQFQDVVTEEKINGFAEEYKGSEEERLAVLEAYTKSKGAMRKVYDYVMLSDMVVDEDRFRKIIDDAIETEEVEEFPKYSGESEKARKARIAKARREKEQEADEAEELGQEIKKKRKAKDSGGSGGGMGDLAALIQQRQQGRADNFLAGLEAKYAANEKGRKKGKLVPNEPPEEAFSAMQKKSDTVEGARKKTKTRK
jgi:DnaJ family protein C protein 9